jgi:hypothetical protein
MTTLRRPVFFQAKIEISYYLEAAARNHAPAFFAGSCSRSYVLDGASIPPSADPFLCRATRIDPAAITASALRFAVVARTAAAS